MELKVTSGENQSGTQTLSVPDKAFGQDFNEALVHQVVTAYLAGARSGTRAQKNRTAVRGGGAKPWRQKGTGRARAGTIRSPLWRGGGVTFAASPQNYGQKVNKKMYRAAMRSIFSELVRQDRLLIVSELVLSEPKTKLILAQLAELGLQGNAFVLLVTEALDRNVELSVRNLPKVDICNVSTLNPVSLIRYEKIVITKNAAERIGEWLA
jgi:large subunit ribosomal protein L4